MITRNERLIRDAESGLAEFYAHIMKHLIDSVQARIDDQVEAYISKIKPEEMKKSSKLLPMFPVSLFDGIANEIEENLSPLKLFIGVQDDQLLDQLDEMGLQFHFLTMKDLFRKTYKIQMDYAKFKKTPKHSYAWRKHALKWMEKNTARHIDKHILNFSNETIDRLKNSCDEAEQALYAKIRHKEKTKELVKEKLIEAVENKKSLVGVKQALKDTTKNYFRNWNLIVKTEFSMAKNVASAQAIEDIGTTLGEDPTVAIVDLDDDRVSEFCETNSRDSEGELRYIKFSELMPAGYNLGKKQEEWKNSIPPRHFNCRCWIVYIPKGFKANRQGGLELLDKGETIRIVSANA